MTNVIAELISNADCIFVIPSNSTENHPVTGLKINCNEIINEGKLIVADQYRTFLAILTGISYMPALEVNLLRGQNTEKANN